MVVIDGRLAPHTTPTLQLSDAHSYANFLKTLLLAVSIDEQSLAFAIKHPT
jgi:hypothetical protein